MTGPARRFRRITAAVLVLLALTIPTATAAQQSSDHAAFRLVHASFETYTPDAKAVTYNQDLVPVGAKASVLGLSGPHGTFVTLAPKGLVPNREYGAHVHARPCGPLPPDSGPHFQNVVDPVQPSTDPAYANPDNEIWLDFTTDGQGNAFAMSTVDWTFEDRRAHSVVIHEHHTHTGDGQAGVAGARLACVNADF